MWDKPSSACGWEGGFSRGSPIFDPPYDWLGSKWVKYYWRAVTTPTPSKKEKIYIYSTKKETRTLKFIIFFWKTASVITISFTSFLKGNITFVCAHTANAAWSFIVVSSNYAQKRQRRISKLLCQRYYALNTLSGHVLHERTFWFTNEISKKRLENALLTEQIERQVLFCTVTSLLLHDDAKIHATLENWREMKTVLSGQTTSRFYSIFQYATTRSSFCVKTTEMTMSGLVLS